MNQPQHAPGWMAGIETLRGIAAVMVVLEHTWALTTMPSFPGSWIIAGFGSYGVTIFFVLSAFLLSPSCWGPALDLRSFWTRRLFRIYPAYAVNVVLLFVFFVPASQLLSGQGVRQTIANLTFTHYLFPNYASSFWTNGSLWTLTIEVILYLVLPFMAWLVAKAPIIATAGFIALGVGYRMWVGIDGDGIREFYFGADSAVSTAQQSQYLGNQFLGYLAVFAVGIAARWFYEQHVRQRLERRPLRPSILTIAILLIPGALMLYYLPNTSYQRWIWFSGFHVVSAVLLVPLMWVAAQHVQQRSFVDRIGEWLGARSYGIYLWHFPLILVFFERGQAFAPPDTSYWPARVALVLAATAVFASISYTQIERPGQELGRRLTRRMAK